jgi:hypothetical protein
MSETPEQRKRRKKQLTIMEQVQEETSIQNAKEVTEALDERRSRDNKLISKFVPDVKAPKLNAQKARAETCGHI